MKGCRILTDNEIKLVLNELGVRDRVLFLTCLTFGTRISEALNLRFGDVAGKSLYIKSCKGSEPQTFPIPASYKEAVKELEQWYLEQQIIITDDLPLFVSIKNNSLNRPITRQFASTVIRNVAKNLNLDGCINTHSFRKTFCNRIFELTNFNLAKTVAYSRHKSMVNLDYYLKTAESVDLVEQLQWS